jgi:sterol desaturase/sphingolipid hydroxylase (fatty acid hydroxylase superfamily)
MGQGWTKDERKKHTRERTRSPKEKAITLGALFLIIALFLAAIYYSIAFRLHPAIPAVLIVVLFLVIIIATFFVDFVFYESI